MAKVKQYYTDLTEKSVDDILYGCMDIENYHTEVVYNSDKPSMIPIRLLDVSKIKKEIEEEYPDQ